MSLLQQYSLILGYTILTGVIVAEITLRIKGGYYLSYDGPESEYLSPYNDKTMWPRTMFSNTSFETKTAEFTYANQFNSTGVRDVEHDIANKQKDCRILLLGDSFTEGVGSRMEESWSSKLEPLINVDTGLTIRIMNAGFAGADPIYCYEFFEKKMSEYSPELVILVLNGSDPVDFMVRGGRERYNDDGTLIYKDRPGMEYLFSKSHLCRFILMRVFDYDWLLISPGEKAARIKEAELIMTECISRFQRHTSESNMDFMVVLHPFSSDLINGQYDFDYSYLESNLASNKVPYLDLFDHFDRNIEEGKVFEYYWENDGHLTPKGNELFASGMGQYLIENVGFTSSLTGN
ncbi:MAG TPA: SGNH/GDSL hydrolase family protein [Flavobacteriales bacterium]|nr:SGNH/GDSL hydrolase family protein [Flavobacteriales bacterium]HIA12478.1 SGNH/GDSL hydrolase family protein [Flavobacteriales bacterium]